MNELQVTVYEWWMTIEEINIKKLDNEFISYHIKQLGRCPKAPWLNDSWKMRKDRIANVT